MTLKETAASIWRFLFDLEKRFVQWWLPVAGAIKGEVSKEERHRVITKAVITYGVSWAGLRQAFSDAEVVAEFLIPLVLAAWAARIEYVARKEHGNEPPVQPQS